MKTLETNLTGANRGNGEGYQNLCSLRSLLLNSGRGGWRMSGFKKSFSRARAAAGVGRGVSAPGSSGGQPNEEAVIAMQ